MSAASGAPTPGFVDAFIDDDAEELYESAPCAYLSTTPDGTIVKLNRTFLTWTGWTAEQLLGTRWQDLLSVGDRIFYETHFSPVLHMQGMTREIALTIVGANGGRLPVMANAAAKFGDDGTPLVLRIVLFDARERRSYEAELVEARRRAEASEQRAATLARTLQASLLPSSTIEIPGLDMGAAYRPAGDGSEVGGDFYDAIEVGNGRWGLVVGDVCGKGVEAAVITSLVRDTVRREVMRTDRPERALEAVRDVMLRYHPDQFCTAVMLTLIATGDGSFAVRSAVGGHLLPVVRRRDGAFERLGDAGTILGMIPAAVATAHRATLHPGDVLLLFTDGVPEGRREGLMFGEDAIERAVERVAAGSAQEIADAVVTDALDFQGGHADDDMAIVVVRVP